MPPSDDRSLRDIAPEDSMGEGVRVPRNLKETSIGRRRTAMLMCALVVLGAIVFSPAIRAPLFLDDYLQGAMVEGTFPAARGPFDLYDFIGDGDRAALTARGLLPWWTDPRLTIRFFRPLSSALLWLDHRAFSHAALPMHLHSFAWWVVAALAAHALFRAALPQRAALVATAIFALAPCHALPLAWVANRESLVSLAFGALALRFQAAFREGRALRDALLASGLFALALLGGGEYALSFGGYVVAMDVARRERAARRVVGWLPFALPALAYLAVRGALGYGTAGSGFYSDPLHEPWAFLASAPLRAVALLATGWLSLDTEGLRTGPWAWALGALVVVSGVLLAAALKRVREDLASPTRSSIAWLLLGSALALVPTLAVVPSRRLLGAAMLGIAATVAVVLDAVWFPARAGAAHGAPSPASRKAAALASLVATALGFAHLVHGPGVAFLASRQHRFDGADFAKRVAVVRDRAPDPASARIGVVRGLAGDFFAPFALDPRGAPPARWCVLAQAGHVLALRRDPHTVELVAPPGRGLYPIGERNLYRAADAPLSAGATLAVPGLRVTVLEATADAGPSRARFVFDEDPDALTWFADDFEEVRAVTLPRVGFGAPFDPRGEPKP